MTKSVEEQFAESGKTRRDIDGPAIYCLNDHIFHALADIEAMQWITDQLGDLGLAFLSSDMRHLEREAAIESMGGGAGFQTPPDPIILAAKDGAVIVWAVFGPKNCGNCQHDHSHEFTLLRFSATLEQLDACPALKELVQSLPKDSLLESIAEADKQVYRFIPMVRGHFLWLLEAFWAQQENPQNALVELLMRATGHEAPEA